MTATTLKKPRRYGVTNRMSVGRVIIYVFLTLLGFVMPTTASYIDNKANMSSIQNTYFAELICNADIDFDATFEKYIKEWNEAGGAEWTKEINEYWASRN